MVRLKVRCRCITLVVVVAQIFLGLWFFSQPLDPPQQFLQRLSEEGGKKILHLKDQPMSQYYAMFGKEFCVREGTVIEKSSAGSCVCRLGWSGHRCGIPDTMQDARWIRDGDTIKNLQLRRRVKRIILLSPFSHEFDVFETNVNELSDLVDVFIIGEKSYKLSNSTSLPLLDRLKSGWLRDHQDKFIYVPVREEGMKNASLMQGVAHYGLRLLSDVRPDDLLIMTSGEEIMSREVVAFLKVFQGYPMPVRCQFKQHLYGFYWEVENSLNTMEICIISLKFFANAFEYQVSKLHDGKISKQNQDFLTSKEQPVQDWTISAAGWRCHLCLPVQDIFHKFMTLPQRLQPKWLKDSPSSMLPFIQRLVRSGQDENLDPVGSISLPGKENLPAYVWQNQEAFAHLIRNPYETVSIHNLA